MAGALIGGLVRSGHAPADIVVVEPFEAQRDKLLQAFGVQAQAQADARLATAGTVVWAVKPQLFAEAAAPCKAHIGAALQLSVMAGIRSDALVAASGSARVVRAMPNTPALIGQGIAGLFARPAVDAAARADVAALFAPTGASIWVDQEDDLDAVTALSGSGPAYVFYFLEAMVQAAAEMGLSPAQGRLLAQSTLAARGPQRVGWAEGLSSLDRRECRWGRRLEPTSGELSTAATAAGCCATAGSPAARSRSVSSVISCSRQGKHGRLDQGCPAANRASTAGWMGDHLRQTQQARRVGSGIPCGAPGQPGNQAACHAQDGDLTRVGFFVWA